MVLRGDPRRLGGDVRSALEANIYRIVNEMKPVSMANENCTLFGVRPSLTGLAGLPEGATMAKHRTYSMAFKRQVVLEFLGRETLHGLSKRHDVSRNLIRVWVAKYEPGEFNDEAEAANLLQEYEYSLRHQISGAACLSSFQPPDNLGHQPRERL